MFFSAVLGLALGLEETGTKTYMVQWMKRIQQKAVEAK
jgi:hypothetical protein